MSTASRWERSKRSVTRKHSMFLICLWLRCAPERRMTGYRSEFKLWAGLLRRRWYWRRRKLWRGHLEPGKLYNLRTLYNMRNLWMGVDYGTSYFSSGLSILWFHRDSAVGDRG